MIEDSINKLTEAVNRLSDVIAKAGLTAPVAPTVPAPAPVNMSDAPSGPDVTPSTFDSAASTTPPTATEEPKKRVRRTKEQITADNAAAVAAAQAKHSGNTVAAGHAIGLNDVREIAQKCLNAGQVEGVREVYVKMGGKTLGDIKPDKYVDLIAALEELHATAGADAKEAAPATDTPPPAQPAPVEKTETPAPAPAKPAAPVEQRPDATKEEIIALAIKLRDGGFVESHLRPINAKFGVQKIVQVKPENYNEVRALLEKAVDDTDAV